MLYRQQNYTRLQFYKHNKTKQNVIKAKNTIYMTKNSKKSRKSK